MTTKLILPPCIIVGGSIRVRADVSYQTLDSKTETERLSEGTREEQTTTKKKVVVAREEYEAAQKANALARGLLKAVCQTTVLGDLCPVEKEAALDQAILDAKAIAATHNATARHHFLTINKVKGYIKTDDEKAGREVAAQLREITDDLKTALDTADVERIREIATRAKALLPVLGKRESDALGGAIQAARKAARTIVKEVGAKGQKIDDVMRELDLSPVSAARALFLDLEVPPEIQAATALNPRTVEIDDPSSAPASVPTPTATTGVEPTPSSPTPVREPEIELPASPVSGFTPVERQGTLAFKMASIEL